MVAYIPQLGGTVMTINGDSAGTPKTLMLRDASGNSDVNELTAAQLETDEFAGNTVTETANFTAGGATRYLIDCTSGPVTVSFNPASSDPNEYEFVKKDSSSNHVNFSGVSGTASLTSQYQKSKAFNDGTTWYNT